MPSETGQPPCLRNRNGTASGHVLRGRLVSSLWGQRFRTRVEKPWESDALAGETFASPMLFDSRLYTINGDGIYRVLDAKTGKLLLEKETKLLPACSYAATSDSSASGRSRVLYEECSSRGA